MPPRARSFGAVAAAYARHRPSYPPAALDWALRPAPGGDVLDLGAGTGKVTEVLLARPDTRMVAVEPDLEMLAQLRADHPLVDAREGSAEQIPLPDASVDAVVVGTAWHWFDRSRAEPEIARVLRPGGVLAVVWNGDDDSVAWVRGYHRALHPDGKFPPVGSTEDDASPGGAAFTPSGMRRFPHLVPMTIDGMVETVATHSWALVAEPAYRDSALARLRAYLVECPETSSGTFALPMVTEVVRTLRR